MSSLQSRMEQAIWMLVMLITRLYAHVKTVADVLRLSQKVIRSTVTARPRYYTNHFTQLTTYSGNG